MRKRFDRNRRPSVIVDAMETDGFAVVEGLLNGEQLKQAAAAVRQLMAEPGETYKWIRQRTYEHFRTLPVFVDLIVHPMVIAIAQAWCGQDLHLIAAQCSRNTKDEPYFSGVTTLHQDKVFFPEKALAGVPIWRYGFTAMWYMQDTPLEMGPTQVVPGSHKRDGDDPPGDDQRVSGIMPAGSLLLFAHATWHSGALNHTDRPRDLISNAYARPELKKVQLTTPVDGGGRYVQPDALLRPGGDMLRQLLGDRSGHAADVVCDVRRRTRR